MHIFVILLYVISCILFVYFIFGVCLHRMLRKNGSGNGLELATIQKHIITSTFRDSSTSNHANHPNVSENKDSDINQITSISDPTDSLSVQSAAKNNPEFENYQGQKDEDEVCLICLDSFRHGDETSHSCNNLCRHRYHKSCITEWLTKNNSCPVCRYQYICTPKSSK